MPTDPDAAAREAEAELLIDAREESAPTDADGPQPEQPVVVEVDEDADYAPPPEGDGIDEGAGL